VVKKKQKRFDESKSFFNYFQPQYSEIINGFPIKGKWNQAFFKNHNPICLELGCGRGEYTIALARKYPNKNYIGIDIKGARSWRGCKTSIDEKMENVAFIRAKIELIEHFFSENEISEIWITHPDPQPRKSRSKKRLTSPEFLNRYRNIIKENCLVHLKTDDTNLYQYTLIVAKANKHKLLFKTDDLYALNPEEEDVMITQTFYEKIFLKEGKKIKYLRFIHNMKESFYEERNED
jgi:tRNA (guanine-N7-)-methyltransferase